MFEYELHLFKECFDLPINPATRQLVNSSSCTAWIASGLSKVAGECGRRMLQDWAGVPGHIFTPLDYCCSNNSGYLPIMVSYHGKNLDIQSVAASVIEASQQHALLITGYEQTPVKQYLERHAVKVHTISLPEHQEDKRFVAVLATWAMVALSLRLAQAVSVPEARSKVSRELADRAYEQAEREGKIVVEEFRKVEDWHSRKWIILGGGVTLPALMAWEAMFAESALMSVIISDIKDYTHGRYLSAMREKNVGFVILTDDATADLGKIMKERLSQLFPVIEIRSRNGRFFSLCKHLFLVAFVISDLSRVIGQNIANPPRPAVTSNWRNWGKIKKHKPDWRFDFSER